MNPETSLKHYFQFPHDDGSFARSHRALRRRRRLPQGIDHGTMCPSYMATREEKHSTRGRAHLLWELMQGNTLTGGESPDPLSNPGTSSFWRSQNLSIFSTRPLKSGAHESLEQPGSRQRSARPLPLLQSLQNRVPRQRRHEPPGKQNSWPTTTKPTATIPSSTTPSATWTSGPASPA